MIQQAPTQRLDEQSPASVARSSTFEQFLELAPDAVVAIDTEGEIVVANSQAEALFGYSRDDLIGGRVETLVPERFGEAYVGHRASYFEDRNTRPNGEGLELFGRRKDGTEFPAEISLSSIETEDGVLATAAIRDISDRVQVEREKAQLEAQLEQSRFETVGQLAGGVAHDFNNILGVIMNYAEFVSEEIGPDSPAAADVEEIRAAAERATALTRQLLIFSRRDVVAPEVLGLNDRIGELESLLEQALGERVDLEAELDADLWPIEIDPGQIDQVLVNLVVNARDAMPGGGTVRIATANVELDEGFDESLPPTEPGTYVQFTVSDTGTGMSEEVVDRALEPFYTTKPKGQGTGLGLATVHGIITGAGGTLFFYSEPGIGTTVKVHLPVAVGTVKDQKAAVTANAGGQGEKVLLVEDDPGVRRMTERILREGGYEVIVAEGGEEALRVLDEGAAVDLLLTDVIMPKMLGTELADRALAKRPDLNLIFMSGYNELVGKERTGSRDEWDASLVEKPYSIDTLLGAIREAIDTAPVSEMTRVLIVDDDEAHRAILKRILEGGGYETTGAAGAAEARMRLNEAPPELALCDVRMPGESGLSLAEDIIANWPATAVVMVTVADDSELAEQALEVGADGYVVKPFTENEILIAALGALKRRGREQTLNRAASKNGLLLRRQKTDLAELDAELASAYEETVTRLSIAVEARDPETSRHVHEMATHAWLIARQLGLDEDRCELIRLAAPLHDVGKVGISDAILLKPGKLTPEERTVMETHAELGSKILGSSRSKLIQMAATIAATHHERFDGTGYPRGLAGEDIPFEGRIAALADVFDAMTRDRPYREALSTDEAMDLVTAERGKHFDPTVFDAFLETRDRKALLFAAA